MKSEARCEQIEASLWMSGKTGNAWSEDTLLNPAISSPSSSTPPPEISLPPATYSSGGSTAGFSYNIPEKEGEVSEGEGNDWDVLFGPPAETWCHKTSRRS